VEDCKGHVALRIAVCGGRKERTAQIEVGFEAEVAVGAESATLAPTIPEPDDDAGGDSVDKKETED
jgi:hypothetical protein